ncbi:diacylglycerol kinase [Cohaesibacter gelatinilyticus]|uniref:Diacylglycerol kinase n=1 Tax=Cohaesibacter gelatinilyticus TaxID=372072 RepID=A0A285NCP4_9HYPH|nr:diacylglycerol kinase [Cohaesibacter gelatinilyticus]SNZ05431.1 diacylglycerol kinase (ATP) [Cohaesibacter gelatinilyticus]
MEYIRHTFRATAYSLAGFKRLMQETAAQVEVIFFCLLLLIYWLVGAEFTDFALLTFFFLIILALEALNTAVEVLVDHLTMDFAEFARQAKDLGSFAVFCGLAMVTLYSGWVIYKTLI